MRATGDGGVQVSNERLVIVDENRTHLQLLHTPTRSFLAQIPIWRSYLLSAVCRILSPAGNFILFAARGRRFQLAESTTTQMTVWRLCCFTRAAVEEAKVRQTVTSLPLRYMSTTCRAVVLPRFGGPEVLELRSNVDVPDLKPRQVLVRTRAVSINPLDARMRSGYGRSIFEPLLPLILGRDVSGEVAAVGASVRSLKVGQEVFGALHPTAVRGTYADYAILDEDELALKPPSLTHVEASAIPFAALTAWRALRSTARITEGQKVLVLGGGGAVGLSAIQISVAAGCRVSTTCGDQSIKRSLELGAEQAIDYTSEDIELSLKEQFDAVLDTIGIPETERLGINVLKKGGHYMTLQGEAASLADSYGLTVGLPAATAILLKKQIQYRYSHGIAYWWTYMRADPEGLDEIRRLSDAGKLKIPVEKTFPITQVTEAHEAKDKRIIPGKVVLEVD